MEIAPGSIIAGKYALDRLVAKGGMGSVWAAHHVRLNSPLAIKFLDPRFAASPSFMERFEREARAAAALHSPNVVHVQDYGIEDGAPYLVMELLKGEDLGARLHRVRRLPLSEAARIANHVGKALRRAHESGIVHRDLKPANLFLTFVDDEEILKVLDFGIAKETDSAIGEATKTGELLGSPHYMSPEQARADKDIDPRADLWSFAVILYRVVTGALPFQGDALGAVLSRVLVDPPPPVRSFAADLPEALDGFFAKALAKSREQRFQSAREMVSAFAAVIGSAPFSSPDPSSLRGPGATFTPSSGTPFAALEPTPFPSATPPPSAFPSLQSAALAATGQSTLTTANISQDPVKQRSSPVPWLVACALAILIAGGAVAFGWSQMQGAAAAPSSEPDATKPSPPALGAQPSETARSAPPPASPPPSATAGAPGAPSSTASATPSAAPSEAPSGGAKKGPKKPSTNGWGF